MLAALSNMTEEQKLTFESEYARRRKKTGAMAMATIVAPLHFFLYGRLGLGIVYLAVVFMMVVGIAVASWMLVLLWLFWWIAELLLIGKRRRDHNGELAVDLARDMKIMG